VLGWYPAPDEATKQQSKGKTMTRIELPIFGIVIEHDNKGNGAIETELGEGFDQIESLLLAMACAGINLRDSAMLEAIETAVEATANY
jgi:hypothetical protein